MTTIETVFFAIMIISLFLLLHSFIFYPISLAFLNLIYKRNYKTDTEYQPMVSIVIAAYNEQFTIEQTIHKLFELDYPRDKFEVLIGSDCSNDETHAIVTRLSEQYPQLRLFPYTTRRGKFKVVSSVVKEAKGEILFFTDANTHYRKDVIKQMIPYFADERIGCVGGRKNMLDNNESIASGNQETTYWSVEYNIKQLEGNLGRLIGCDGGIYSMRANLYPPPPVNSGATDDFYISMTAYLGNKDIIYIDEAIADEYVGASPHIEYLRKKRLAMTNWSSISSLYRLLNPFRGLIAYCFWSHKVLRWSSSFFMLFIFISNAIIASSNKYLMILFIMQSIFYISAILGFLLSKLRVRFKPFLLVYYFVLTNIAFMIGTFKFIKKIDSAIWVPTPRK